VPSLSEYTVSRQSEYLRGSTAARRRNQGQVFTPPEIARFMAGLFSQIPQSLRLLDPGAGSGVLSAAVCDRVLELGSPRELYIHAFETEPALAEMLRQNLEHCKRELGKAGHTLHFTVQQEDFIVAASPYMDGQVRLFGSPAVPESFDAVIMNPPYFKVRKDSEHAKLMERVVHGQPNAYAFFLALAARLLRPNAELVAITPRSFCNGLYFRGFRHWFFDRMSLDHIHLFESRTEAFRESGVLQESVITKSHKLGERSPHVTITGSYGKDIPRHLEAESFPHNEIVDDSCGQRLVKIPVTQDDYRAMRLIEALPLRFDETGLRISTGPVVTFRATELLLREPNGERLVPLLMPHNVKPYRTEWPIPRKQHPVYILDCETSRKRRLLLPRGNYVLLRRFSAKEEKRRLVAACLLRSEQKTQRIAFENHLNYVYHFDRELTEDETFGVAALFNSAVLDRYFRVLSGNTQVNATEIRNLHFPSLGTLASVGREVRSLADRRAATVECIVTAALGEEESLVASQAMESP
jgi:adenine-specific DNA-methyltransferase